MLYDTHAHVNFAAFKDDYERVTRQSLDAGMFLNYVGTQKDTSKEAVELARKYADRPLYAVIGLHPIHTIAQQVDEEESHFISREEKFDYAFYKQLASDSKVVGIGECGLDYYRLPEGMSKEQAREIQSAAFEQQIRLANELDKALVIHCRASKDSNDAYEDILAILQKEKPQRFEIHSFTSDLSIAQKFLDLGGYIGLNGIITFDKSGVLREVAQKVPLEKIVLETDAPYLAPAPYRGKRCLPEYVEYTARFIAEARGITYGQVCEQTTANARKLFKV
ncbi:TatD family hydrolase [Patescibacteria group bacterium]|nr:TatD family hydrolase [Patescibacteria group bacterium]